MNNYFKERMDEIQLRTEQMEKRKIYESEIDSLEKKLKEIESNYERLEKTCKSNLEQSALKQVDLVVAKEAHEFAKAMLDEKQVALFEERRKLDNLHWKVWEEQIKSCDEMVECLAENDSVSFLNEYPRVLKTKKLAFFVAKESDDEIKKSVVEHPEIKELAAEVAALETEIKNIEDSCLSRELEKVLTEIRELDTNDNYKIDETHRLIEALEASHRERMSLEAEITEIEKLKNDEEKLKISQRESKDFSCTKNEQYYTFDVGLLDDEKEFKGRLENDKDKKLKARKWYEEYTQEIEMTNEENDSKKFYTPREDIQSEKNEDEVKDPDGINFGISKVEFDQKTVPKRSETFEQSSQPLISRFFDKEIQNPCFLFANLKPKSNFELENEDVKVISQGTLNSNRKFKPFMATSNTFFKSAAETTLVDNLVQSNYNEELGTPVQGITKVKKTVKFTPKRPSNIGNKSLYRQTKLDDFDKFMLPDNKKYTI